MPMPLKPTAIKVMEGNPGKKALNFAEPKPDKLSDLAPPIPLSGAALDEWERITPHLDKLGLLTVLDVVALAAYCKAWARYQEAERTLAQEGILVDGHRGVRTKNPAAQVARDSLADLLRICTEFGMTPSSRGRISVPGSDTAGPDIDGMLS